MMLLPRKLWILDNHLTINILKTKCMTTSRLRETIPLEVKVNGLEVIRSVAPFGQFAFSVLYAITWKLRI